MSALAILLCCLPPLAVMAVAAVHGMRTGNAAILTALVLSGFVLFAPFAIPLFESPDPAPSIRFAARAPPREVAPPRDDYVRLQRYWLDEGVF